MTVASRQTRIRQIYREFSYKRAEAVKHGEVDDACFELIGGSTGLNLQKLPFDRRVVV